MPRRARGAQPTGVLIVLLVLGLSLVTACATVSGADPGPTMTSDASLAAALTTAPASPSPSIAPRVALASAEPTTAPPTTPPATPAPTSTPTPPATPPATSLPEPTLVAVGSPAPSIVPQASTTDPTSAQPAVRSNRAGLDRATRRRLATIMRNTVRNKGIAGLQVAVRMTDGRTWLGSAGSAEFQPGRPVGDDTVFAIASVTKTFIAALILQLADEGKLGLDETFGRYEPAAPRGKKVTIRQLLSHTSGIYDYFGHPRYLRTTKAWTFANPSGMNDRDHEWTYEEILGLVKSGYCKPGRCYRYSNTNYVILGRVAEAAGGAPLHEQLRERFFEPLGLTGTYYQPAEVPPADAAHGHWPTGRGGHVDHTRDAQVLPFMAAASVADAAGAIASTASDLATWADALYGGRVLKPASLRQMTTILRPGYYGLGTDVAEFVGHRALGHRGGLRGYESSMWHFPDRGVSIALLSNQGNWYLAGTSTDVTMNKLVRAVLGKAPDR